MRESFTSPPLMSGGITALLDRSKHGNIGVPRTRLDAESEKPNPRTRGLETDRESCVSDPEGIGERAPEAAIFRFSTRPRYRTRCWSCFRPGGWRRCRARLRVPGARRPSTGLAPQGDIAIRWGTPAWGVGDDDRVPVGEERTEDRHLHVGDESASNSIYDVEFVDGRDGRDVATLLDDSIRYARAGYAVVHTVIDKETP
jgi:hypothetical protein